MPIWIIAVQSECSKPAAEGGMNSRIYHFNLNAFNQSVLCPLVPKCIAPRTAQGCHNVELSSTAGPKRALLVIVHADSSEKVCSDLPVK